MSDEPTLGELSRRMDGVTSMLGQLVQRTEYAADQRLTERRFTEVERDVTEMRHTLADDIKALKQAMDNATEKRGSNVRQAIYAGLLPAVLVLLGIAVQLWTSTRGG